MLTVLIATYNGAKTLPKVLSKYCSLQTPEGGWKLVIVDNGSTDDTRRVISDYRTRLPITYCFEAKRGKNAALNTGVSSIAGDLIVLTDDDAIPDSGWLRCYRSAADRQPDFSIFGGPILPLWEIPPPDWILERVPLGPTFTLLKARREGPVEPRFAFGPNMALRATVFEQGYRFDESIGPNRSSYPMGSEAELTKRLASARFRAWHCSEAVVHHIIDASQMNPEWVLERAIRYGRGQHRLAAKFAPAGTVSLLGVPIPLLWEIAVQQVRVAVAICRRDEGRIFKSRWHLNYLFGKAMEARILQDAKSPFAGSERPADFPSMI